MKFFGLLLITLFSFQTSQAGVQEFTNAADGFFKSFVTYGKVDYEAVKAEGKSLNALVQMIASQSKSELTGNKGKSFYINAYNVLVIKSVVDKFPIEGPLAVPGFFKGTKHSIAGEKLTLEQIEKNRLSAKEDPRLHFALVCAANGCPKLANYAFTSTSLNAQLDKITRQAVNNKYFIKVDDAKGTVKLSQIFEWYAADFKSAGSNLAYINQYRSVPIPSSYSSSFYTYDWRLNQKKK